MSRIDLGAGISVRRGEDFGVSVDGTWIGSFGEATGVTFSPSVGAEGRRIVRECAAARAHFVATLTAD